MLRRVTRLCFIGLVSLASLGSAVAQNGFAPKTSPGSGIVTTADFNRDGYADLLENTSNGSLVVAYNDKAGGFSTRKTLLTGTSSGSSSYGAGAAVVADFNGDGYPDVAACVVTSNASGNTYTVNVYLNENGNFTLSDTIALPYSCVGLAAGDVNHDGRADLVVGQTNYVGSSTVPSYLSTYFGDGAGHFGTPVTQEINIPYTSNQYTFCQLGEMVGSDFKGDGNFDLLLYGSCTDYTITDGNLYYAASEGNGNYILTEVTEKLEAPYGPMQLVNLNNDTLPDVVVVDSLSGPHGSEDYNAVALVNNGGGNFTVNNEYNENDYAASYDNTVYAVSAADFNGDGKPDLVVGYYYTANTCCTPGNSKIAILNGQGSSKWSQSQTFNLAANEPIGSVVAADFNNDNRPDFLVATSGYNGASVEIIDYLNTQTYPVSSCKPSGPGIHVCAPASTSGGTVQFIATAAQVTGPVRLMELWVDGKKIANYAGNMVQTSLALSAGSHTASFIELEYNNQSFKKTVNFTVNSTASCSAPSSAGVHICSPASGASVSSPVEFSAAATPVSGAKITAMRLYVDGVAKYTVSSNHLTTSQALTAGTHSVSVVGYESNGAAVKTSETISVK